MRRFPFPIANGDEISNNCEAVYIGIRPIGGPVGPPAAAERSDSGTDLSAIDTRAEAERAEAAGLLRQIR